VPQDQLGATPRRARLAAWVALLVLALGLPFPLRAGQVVSFHLVPEGSWKGGRPNLSAEVQGGKVKLYQEGAYEPKLIVPAGDPGHDIPPGRWLWIAEAPGYVSVGSGVLDIPARGTPAAPKVLIWPVVPACDLTLQADRRWQSVDRLDLVSVSYATVYPLAPKAASSQKVPAGRYLAYTVGARGLIGISRVASCRAGETRQLTPPAPPAAGRQDFLVHVTLPDDRAIDSQDLAITLSDVYGRAPRARALPAAAVWSGRRGSFFFLGAPASALDLAVAHPRLRTRTLAVEPLGGSARELPEQAMRLRRSLRFLVDYRPARAHRSAKVVAYACGPRRLDSSAIDLSRCRALGHEVALASGPSPVLFADLDDGQYQVDAVIDDETVHGLGNRFAPYLDPGTDDAPSFPPMQLAEFEIYGNLVLKDKPVPGEVHLRPIGGGPVRRFATGRDLLYHLFYFGYLADRFAFHEIPEELQRADAASLRGLYFSDHLEACGGTGTCRLFNVHSTLSGGGRLDLDLGSGVGLDVEVVSRATGDPIGQVLVGVDRADPALHFVRGAVAWKVPLGREGQGTYTDEHGRARIRNLKPGSVSVAALKEGFKLARVAAEVREGARSAVRIEIESDGGASTVLRFPDGAPVGQAFLLVIDEKGGREMSCSRATAADGSVELPRSCLDKARVVVLHPEAAITAIDGSAWLGARELTVERAPARPVTVRVSDSEGRPLAGVPVAVRFHDFELAPNDLLLAATSTGTLLFYLTDDHGEATLRGVDPADASLPEVTTAADLGIKPVPLAGTRPGGTVELVAPN